LLQLAGEPHVPFVPHVWTPLPLHWVVPGAHTPVQAPETQAWLAQAAGSLHVALTSHVWTPLPEHCTAPGVQEPWHPPPVELAVALQLWLHWTAGPQVPPVPHVSTPLPEHWVDPGVQTPVQLASAQA
jgi:hypothetical protein